VLGNQGAGSWGGDFTEDVLVALDHRGLFLGDFGGFDGTGFRVRAHPEGRKAVVPEGCPAFSDGR
jgi:hypothetical protein